MWRIIVLFVCLQYTFGENFSEDLLKQQSGQLYWEQNGKRELERALKTTINDGIARNVILFIGDGMGPNTITAARVANGGESSSFKFEKFPHIGLLKTYATDSTVPDSACTASALYSGVKSNVETFGVDAGVKLRDCEAALDSKHHLSNIIEWAQKAGKSTGFVTNNRVTHATPGPLYGHSADRKWECDATMPAGTKCKDIARQLVEDERGRNLKVIMGGGRQCMRAGMADRPFDPIDKWACNRADGLDLVETWKKDKMQRRKKWQYLESALDLKNLDWSTEYVLGLFANSHFPYEDELNSTQYNAADAKNSVTNETKIEDRPVLPTLAEMVRAAIYILKKNPKGYLLVVEGGNIDQAHHRGFVRRALRETILFNDAVTTATELTDSSETLLMVTADHAHGLTINGLTKSRNDIYGVTKPSKIDNIPFSVLTYIIGGPKNFHYSAKDNELKRTDPRTMDTSKPDYSPQSGFINDEVVHGGVDVPIFAQGPMAHLFHSVHEQSYVAHVIAYAAAIGEYSDRGISTSAATTNQLSIFLIMIFLYCTVRLN